MSATTLHPTGTRALFAVFLYVNGLHHTNCCMYLASVRKRET